MNNHVNNLSNKLFFDAFQLKHINAWAIKILESVVQKWRDEPLAYLDHVLAVESDDLDFLFFGDVGHAVRSLIEVGAVFNFVLLILLKRHR